jgi:DNA-directed RNA polymerase subunit RPC12/RpoP
MDALDGNAIGGALFEHYGAEMTSVRGKCGYCGAVSHVAELRVYMRGPGTVGRCPHCGNVVLVMVAVREVVRVEHSRFAMTQPG